VRGVTAASETATAQEIKGRWVGVRLTRKRETVIYTVKSMLKIMAQLLVSHITPQNLQRMTQMEISEEMMQVLKNDMMMEFSIDIETDSTVAKDEFKERETFQEMLNGVAQFAQSVLPMVQQNALPADVSSAVLSAALKPYAKYDRNLEEALSSLPQTQQQLQELNQQLQQTQQQLTESQQQAQQWQSAATLLQQQSTEAGSQQKTADAEKKKAETREIMQGLEDGKIQPLKTVAEIGNIEAQTDVYKKTNPNSGGRNG
jgi:septal ring factor EnvC (AmiA/AmiB activator)